MRLARGNAFNDCVRFGAGDDLSGYNPSPTLPYCCLFPPCTNAPLRIERIERVGARLVYSL